jgi:anti-sigma factor RsiW
LICRDAVELVADYLEGKLSPRERRAFERHLSASGDCTASVEQMRAALVSPARSNQSRSGRSSRRAALAAFRELHRGP